MLIFRLRSRYALSPQKFYKQLLSTSSHIVTLGAWITVLAIGLDPFTQQLFRPVVCEHGLRDGIARIPRATNLTGTTVNAANNVAPALASAIYAGLLGDARKLNFECSTGNCTFPGNTTVGSFQTIGLDAGCVDISSELIVEKKQGDNSRTLWYLPALGNSTKAIGQQAGPVGTYGTTWSSPFAKHWPWERDIALYSFAALFYVTDHECAEVEEAAFRSTCSQAAFGSNCSLAAFISKWNCSHALAVECKLWPTIQTIHAQIDLSEIKEEVVASGPMTLVPDPRAPSNRSWQDSWLEVPEETIQDGKRKACTPSMTYTADTPVDISNNAFWTFYDKIDKPVPSNLTWYADECVFWIPPGAGGGLADFLDTLFDKKQLKGLYGAIATAHLDGDVWIKNLYENGNATLHTVQARVRRLARSMNTYFRNSNSTTIKKTIYATGSALKTDTCIQVQWPWLAFPATLVILSVVFLALTVWTTRRTDRSSSGRGAWKSSALAVLFSGLHDEIRQDYRSLEKQSEMADCARRLEVNLELTESGWRMNRRPSI